MNITIERTWYQFANCEWSAGFAIDTLVHTSMLYLVYTCLYVKETG